MKHTSSQTGYSLIEVLVSIALLLIAIVAPMTIATQGIRSSSFALEQNTAYFLAQEGIEAIFSIQRSYAVADIKNGMGDADPDTSWEWLDTEIATPGPCSGFSGIGATCSFGVDFSDTTGEVILTDACDAGNESICRLKIDTAGTRAVYTHNSGVDSDYTRIITITRTSSQSVEVRSVVTWESQLFQGTDQSVVLTSYLFDSNY